MSPALRHVVCRFADLAAPGARGFSPPGAHFPDDYFLVRHGDALRAYRMSARTPATASTGKPTPF